MAISTGMPANLRTPLFYARFDASQAGQRLQKKRTLLIGQKLELGTAAVHTPLLVSHSDQAKRLFGTGSMLARMVEMYRKQDGFGEVWCIAVADNPASAAASTTLTVTGTATANGTLQIYIGGQRVSVKVSASDPAETIAATLNAAVNALNDLPVRSEFNKNVVFLAVRWKGLTGNDLRVVVNFRGSDGGETLPAGIALTLKDGGVFNGGTGNPSLAETVLAAMGDEEYDYVIHPYSDSASLDAFQVEYNDAAGRWSWSRQVYGHCYTALRGTPSTLAAFGKTRNDPHHTIAVLEADCPAPCWEFAAAYGGANAVCITEDPARPTQTTALNGVLPPRAGKRLSLIDRQLLLNYGMATSVVSGGALRIERAITTYQKNSWDQPDASYLDSETLHTLAEIIRTLHHRITQKYGRHKLADDGTRFGPGQAIVTPNLLRSELQAVYSELEDRGLVENAALFNQHLMVERDSQDANRVNVLLPPDLVNQLRCFTVLTQFRLQYS